MAAYMRDVAPKAQASSSRPCAEVEADHVPQRGDPAAHHHLRQVRRGVLRQQEASDSPRRQHHPKRHQRPHAPPRQPQRLLALSIQGHTISPPPAPPPGPPPAPRPPPPPSGPATSSSPAAVRREWMPAATSRASSSTSRDRSCGSTGPQTMRDRDGANPCPEP